MKRQLSQQQVEEAQKSPTYWFLVLERAREAHDFATAADAQRQLKGLGVVVSYRQEKSKRGEAVYA